MSALGPFSPSRLAVPMAGFGLRAKGQRGKVLAQEGRRQGGGMVLGENRGPWLRDHQDVGNSPEDCVTVRGAGSKTSLPAFQYWLRHLLAG